MIGILVDALAIVASGTAAFLFQRLLPNVSRVGTATFILQTVIFLGVAIFFGSLFGLYRATYRAKVRKQCSIAARSYICSVSTILASFYVLQHASFPRSFTLVFFLVFPAFFILGRIVLYRFNIKIRAKGFGLHNVLVVGNGNGGVEACVEKQRSIGFFELGYVIKGFLREERPDKDPGGATEGKSVPKYHKSKLISAVKKDDIDEVFVYSPTLGADGYRDFLETCRLEQINFRIISPEVDRVLRLARVYDMVGITLHSSPRTRIEFLDRVTKRGMDILGALIALVILSPVFILSAVAIFIESGRPIIFKQKRSLSKYGKTLQVYKFRSMIKEADQMKETLMEMNQSDGALFKLRSDPRVTKVGKIIRKFSIDELPQLFNVLKGDMSLVGPRPLPISDYDKINGSMEFFQATRLREKLKPGITGLWQISGRSDVRFKEMVLLDLYYLENQSISFDLEILFGTIPVVLFGNGAY
jgi:exopolysaccharide biosynthesis polyprenyl glycosylphosphotransferase